MANEDLLALMFVRALLINSRKGQGMKCTHAPVVIWEDIYPLDIEKLPQKETIDDSSGLVSQDK